MEYPGTRERRLKQLLREQKKLLKKFLTALLVRPLDKEPVVDNSKQKTPEHPFSNTPEAHYMPLNTKNFGAPAEKIPKDKEMAYRTVVPATEKQLVDDVF